VGKADDVSWIAAGLKAKEKAKAEAQQSPKQRKAALAAAAAHAADPLKLASTYVICNTEKCLAHLGPSSCTTSGVSCSPEQNKCTTADVAASGQVRSHTTTSRGITEIIRLRCKSTLPDKFIIDSMSAHSSAVGPRSLFGRAGSSADAESVARTTVLVTPKAKAVHFKGFAQFMGADDALAMKVVTLSMPNTASDTATAAHGLNLTAVDIVSMETMLRTRSARVVSNDNLAAATNGDHESPLYSAACDKHWVSVNRRSADKAIDGATLTTLIMYRQR
jgi:hypothetical protein